MKKLSLIIFLFVCSMGVSALAGEVSVAMPEYNPTDEINTMFLDDENTNYTLQPKTQNKNKNKSPKVDKKTEKQKVEKIKEEKPKTEKPKKEEKKVSKKKEQKPTEEKQKININLKNDDKVLKKEEELKKKQEDEKRRYRELEELTELNRQGVALYNDNNLDDAMASFLKIPENMRTAEVWLLIGNILFDKGKKKMMLYLCMGGQF